MIESPSSAAARSRTAGSFLVLFGYSGSAWTQNAYDDGFENTFIEANANL